jgi:hypothetical protein
MRGLRIKKKDYFSRGNMNAHTFIATRQLTLGGKPKRRVMVGIKAPTRDGVAYRCEFQIAGLGDGKIRYALGADGIQALLLALKTIGAELYMSTEAKNGLLTLDGSHDLDFPLPDVIASVCVNDGGL